MRDWNIDTAKDPIAFALAALKSDMAGLETINFSEAIPSDKIAAVCASLEARGIKKISISADADISSKMMHDFIVCGFIPTGELLSLEIDGKSVYAFEFEKENTEAR